MRAVRIQETGGPDVMTVQEVERPTPRRGQVLIKVEAAGVNFADLAQREGQYLSPTRVPMTMGFEAAGIVEELGPEADAPPVGTRVAALVSGGYAEYALAVAPMIVPLPDSLDSTRAAALLVQGITAYQLLRDAAHLQAGESVLVHAAAGGVGTFAVQIARLMGAGTVIGTASSEEKRGLARRLGADEAMDYTQADWPQRVRAATGGKGADVILEMVGGENTQLNMKCLAPFGRMVVFGAASGQPSVVSPAQLMLKNQSVIGYWLTAWMARPERVGDAIQGVMAYVARGELEIVVGETFPLAEAVAAHRAIADRKTTGKVVLVP